MKRLKIMKAYAVLWLFIYFLVQSNIEAMATFFFATLTFNLAVLTVLVIGMIVILKASISLVMLAGTFGTLAYKKTNLSFYLQGIDKIMPANIAHMFHSRAEKGVLLFTSEESRAVIEWIDEKFANQSRYINYFIGTSLMIGLLGTFTGLLVSIDQMGKIILSLSGDIDLGAVIRSFSGPLGGMATGFGSSLFGVITAIILGLMGYILNKNQEVLIEGVEDWLKGRIIDSGGASTAAVGLPGGNAEQLPDQRSSFIDVFIDNISSLTTEMAKVAQTNERLHTITIASVQQARDEHELSYELFKHMNENLLNIDTTAKSSAGILDKRLNNLEEIIHSTHDSFTQELKIELKELSSILVETLNNSTDKAYTQNNEIISSITKSSEKADTQNEMISKLLLSIDAKLKTQLEFLQNDDSKDRLESIRVELHNLATLFSQKGNLQNENFQELLKSLEILTNKIQEEMKLTHSIQELNKSQLNTSKQQGSLTQEISNHLETLNKTLFEQSKQQKLTLATQNDSKELLEKQREILELLVGKNEDSLDELKRISSFKSSSTSMNKETKTPQVQTNDKTATKDSSSFFTKLFD